MTRTTFASPAEAMRRAIELARRGVGLVEPNPPVGAVIVDSRLQLVSEGWHERFGGPHAEVMAIERAGPAARGATLFITLEPCSHFGKTPPCVDAILAAGLGRVVAGMIDPFPEVSGRGIERLREAGLEVEVGLLENEVRRLTQPFSRLITAGRPWVHAKWAMTLDGRTASHGGASKWISNESSRAIVHKLRGHMDAIVTGIGTVLADDPLLTARPPGPRVATRVVFDSRARIPVDSQLVRTAGAAPLLVVCGPGAAPEAVARLRSAGVEVIECSRAQCAPDGIRPEPAMILSELGRRRMTNVLIEGGSELLGTFFERELIDEVHVFVAPKLLGGTGARSALAGTGRPAPADLPDLEAPEIEVLNGDVYIHGELRS